MVGEVVSSHQLPALWKFRQVASLEETVAQILAECVCVCVSMWKEEDEILRTEWLCGSQSGQIFWKTLPPFCCSRGSSTPGIILPTHQGLHKASTSLRVPVLGPGFRPQGTEGRPRNSVLCLWMALVSVEGSGNQ